MTMRTLLFTAAFGVAGCDKWTHDVYRDHALSDLRYSSVYELPESPHGVRCFVLVGTASTTPDTLTCVAAPKSDR